MSTTGTSSPAVVYDWLALNVIDALLTIGGSGTYFKHTIETHIAFAQEFYEQQFDNLTFNKSNAQLALEKTHDYICKVALYERLPGIIGVHQASANNTTYPYLRSNSDCYGLSGAPTTNRDCVPRRELLSAEIDFDFTDSEFTNGGSLIHTPFAHWVNGAGFRAIERLELKAGNLPAETHTFRTLYAWEELSGGAGKRQTYQAGLFKTREELIRASLTEQKLYINIPFFFTYFYGNSLSIVRSQLAKLSYALQTATITDMIICATDAVKPYLSEAKTTGDWATDYTNNDAHGMQSTGTEITNSTALTWSVMQQVIYLEDSHRKLELAKAEDQEMNVLMCITECVEALYSTPPANFLMYIEGSNPATEVIVMCQLVANQSANDWFNFSRIGPENGAAVGSTALIGTAGSTAHEVKTSQLDQDPLLTLKLLANKGQRMAEAPAQHWRILTPSVMHTNIPNKSAGAYIYVMPIALFPEDMSGGSGSTNLGRIEGFGLYATVHPSVRQALTPNHSGMQVYVQVRLWSIWSYYGHASGPRFSHTLSAK